MFLDDKLYNHVSRSDIKEAKDFQTLMNDLYKITEDHFKPQLKAGVSYDQGKTILDRVFNSWNLFINRLDKENYFLTDFIKENSYKIVFMNNPDLVEIYNKGK